MIGLAAFLLMAFVGATLWFTEASRKKLLCTAVNISVPDYASRTLYTEQEVFSLMGVQKNKLLKQPINTLQTREMEEKLLSNTILERADLYLTADGVFHIDLIPRTPVLRIINRQGSTFYLDRDGYFFQAPTRFVAYVPVATGNISQRVAKINTHVSDSGVEKVVRELYHLAGYLLDNEFWLHQAEQIYVDDYKDICLIPRVGSHTIVLGNMENYEEKFRNLETFYEKGLQVMGWDKYSKINVKFKGQIVCTKK